jgi:hypothetical protein
MRDAMELPGALGPTEADRQNVNSIRLAVAGRFSFQRSQITQRQESNDGNQPSDLISVESAGDPDRTGGPQAGGSRGAVNRRSLPQNCTPRR